MRSTVLRKMKILVLIVSTSLLSLCFGCRSTRPSDLNKWKDTGTNGWDNFQTEEGRFSKVLVGLGTGIRRLNNIEIIDLSNDKTVCAKLPNFPQLVHSPVGGLLSSHSKPVICGIASLDHLDNVCYTYLVGHHQWHRSEGLVVSRGPMTASTIYQADDDHVGGLLLTGGMNGPKALNVDLLVYSNNQLSNLPLAPEMPTSTRGHCSVTLNSTTVLITGGYNEKMRELNTVHFYHVDRQEWVKGPNLKFARQKHSCTLMRTYAALSNAPKSAVIVGGGVGELEENLSSVEYLIEGSPEWTLGSNLPTPIRESSMITDHLGAALIIGGSSPDAFFLDQIYRLASPESEWHNTTHQLKIPRQGHVAFKIPDSLASCHIPVTNATLQQRSKDRNQRTKSQAMSNDRKSNYNF